MRKSEIIRDKHRAVKIIKLSYDTVEGYIQACECPYCRDGIVYKMLPVHISQIHGITAYEFRKEYGMNRGHRLISPETSEKMSIIHRETVKTNKGLMEYDRKESIKNRYKDGGQRSEAIKSKIILANLPEHKIRFAKAMAGVDRRAVAMAIPVEIRNRHMQSMIAAWREKVPREHQIELMMRARSLRTAESEKIRLDHAKKTMRKYFDDPEWRERWKDILTRARQANMKVPKLDYPKIVKDYEKGISPGEIASNYGVSNSLIYLIIKTQRLGLKVLFHSNMTK